MYDGSETVVEYGSANERVDEARDYDRVQSAFEAGDADDILDGDIEALGGRDDADETLEISAHRNLLGETLETVADELGEDVATVAQRAGIARADVEALTQRDLIRLARFLAENYPETMEEVAVRYPSAQNILATLADQGGEGGGGGVLGGTI